MDILLPVVYIVVLILQVVMLAAAVRRPAKRKWAFLYLCEAGAALAAWVLMRWYDNLPGYGMMPGLTYFAEAFFSMCAAGIYAVMLVVSLGVGAAIWYRRRGK